MILTIAAQKGGVGKTTTAAAIAQALKAKSSRNKVLLIDMDGQRSASIIYGADEDAFNIYNVLMGNCKAVDAIQDAEAGEIIQGSSRLYSLDVELAEDRDRDKRLKRALIGIQKKYSHIIIDTAPGYSTGLIQALTAADAVIVPVQCNAQAFNGTSEVFDTIGNVKKLTNKNLTVLGILATRYQPRTILARQYEELIKEAAKEYGTKMLKTRIRQGVAVEEAQALRTDLYKYAPKSKPAEDYFNLIKELKL